MVPLLLTFGHGRLDAEGLAGLLRGAGIERVVDVRRFPGSRANPAAARGAVEELATGLGIGYRWDERLGGRRSLTAPEDVASMDPWWQVAAFRAYAGWTRSPEFRAAVADLLRDCDAQVTAVMCSEAVWWRCHRRIIADVLTLAHATDVRHVLHSGEQSAHPVSAGARRCGDNLYWDRTD
ncbi:DUF488 domain-containing protein [Occultella glacieicola]|uniref:DUF488 domain-containing protein n=1 Tax=Occultella glacieicola TaxID=2518684 RepID=A0ABY2E7B1_9MICO|nr:DUF488 domain-containing protein [Occultella glacieicola]TDE97446.1 DUF488 domain-containing protein [Occultella glacieicola]